MYGHKIKAVWVALSFLSTSFLPLLTYGGSTNTSTKMGCMACHIGESNQTSQSSKKNVNKQHQQKSLHK